jgi:hypothetical protein
VVLRKKGNHDVALWSHVGLILISFWLHYVAFPFRSVRSLLGSAMSAFAASHEKPKLVSQLMIRVRKMNGEEVVCTVHKLASIYQLLECIYDEWDISKSAQALHYEGTHSKKSELPGRVYTLDDKLVCLGDLISSNEMGEELLFLLIQTERPEDTLRAARELLDRRFRMSGSSLRVEVPDNE